jgi:hypothetical protein
VSAGAVIAADIPYWVAAACLMFVLVCGVSKPSLSVARLAWDLNKKTLKIKFAQQEPWRSVKRIHSIYHSNVFVYLRVSCVNDFNHHLVIFWDSLERDEYRKLLSAVRLGKLKIEPATIQSL